MLVTPLGIGAAFGTEDYGYTCTLVNRSLLIDTGPQVLMALNGVRVAVDDLSGVLITHFHPDHILGFPLILPARRAETPPLPVYGPEGLEECLTRLSAAVGRDKYLGRVSFHEISSNPDNLIKIAGHSVQPYRMEHSDICLGYQIADPDGTGLAYSGDTSWCPSLADMIRRSDHAMVEMTELENQTAEHMSLMHDLPKVLAEAGGNSRVLITHLAAPIPRYEEGLSLHAERMDGPPAEKLKNVSIVREREDYILP
jgi:ribonuclease BN (tRNA processing enzyme)